MIVCPLCEHAQSARAECEVCGRALAVLPPPPGEVGAVEGLEPTSLGGGGPEAASLLSELEPTRYPPVVAAPAAVPELEPNRPEPVEVLVTPAPGIERTSREPGDDPRTAVPPLVTCRYCRTAAAPGERVCGRCGMRLPTFAAPREATPDTRRCGCGAAVDRWPCPACGAREG